MPHQQLDQYRNSDPDKPARFDINPDLLLAAMEYTGDDRVACVLLEDGMPVAAVVVLRGHLTTDYLKALDDEASASKRTEGGPMQTITQRQDHILRHALGVTHGREEYRNHYVTDRGSDSFADCEALVGMGLMSRHKRSWVGGYIYAVTSAGREAITLRWMQLSINGTDWYSLISYPAAHDEHLRHLTDEIKPQKSQLRIVDHLSNTVATWNSKDGWIETEEESHA